MSILYNLKNFNEKYSNKNPEQIQQYGTSGFRNKSDKLYHITFRIGILATLRSSYLKGNNEQENNNNGHIVGVMITASHNPSEDNGVKIIEPDGSMLEQSWELLATKIANVRDEDLENCIEEIIKSNKIDLIKNTGLIYLAMDTRESGPLLMETLIDGIKCSKGKFENFQKLTTPQLHYIVYCANSNGKYGKPTENGYYEKLSKSFDDLLMMMMMMKKKDHQQTKKFHLILDCANGIGGLKMEKFQKNYLQKKEILTIDLINNGDGILNYKCGADFVKSNQSPPLNLNELKYDQLYSSFDGDADRIIFFYRNKFDKKFHLLDGDKIAILFAKYLNKILNDCQLSSDGSGGKNDDNNNNKIINIEIIQTAYANGNSTKFIKENLKLSCDCVPTGVKHLHKRALKSEIGIYFEANGHGTILFNKKIMKKISEFKNEQAKKKLLNFIDLINQTVGDAISILLAVVVMLLDLNLTIEEWDQFYNDLPNKLLKLKVKDRTIIETTDAERRCVKPIGLQNEIDKVLKEMNNPDVRSFIRPSGTEDIVRIYAEAPTEQMADLLAKKVANLVYDFANGIGEKFQI